MEPQCHKNSVKFSIILFQHSHTTWSSGFHTLKIPSIQAIAWSVSGMGNTPKYSRWLGYSQDERTWTWPQSRSCERPRWPCGRGSETHPAPAWCRRTHGLTTWGSSPGPSPASRLEAGKPRVSMLFNSWGFVPQVPKDWMILFGYLTSSQPWRICKGKTVHQITSERLGGGGGGGGLGG